MKRRSPYGQYRIETRQSLDITEFNSDQGSVRDFLGKQYLLRLECSGMTLGCAADSKQWF